MCVDECGFDYEKSTSGNKGETVFVVFFYFFFTNILLLMII